MFIELNKTSKLGYAYESVNAVSDFSIGFEYDILNKELLKGIIVYKIIAKSDIKVLSNNFNIIEHLQNYHCKNCNKIIEFKHINRLPEEGWEELIDHWSCHNSEFKSMLNLKMKPRENGILINNFYLVPDKKLRCGCTNFSELAKNTDKIFYNYLYDPSICKKFVLFFFKESFVHNNKISLCVEDKYLEIKLFEETYVLNESTNIFFEALKVGYKKYDRKIKSTSGINKYFFDLIVMMLEKNSVNIEVLGLTVSFIIFD